MASVSGTPEAEQVDARFCIRVPQRAGERLLLNMVDRRSPGAFSGFKDGQSPRSARGYELLALAISTPTSLNRNDVTSSDSIDLVTPQKDPNHTGFIATTSGGD